MEINKKTTDEESENFLNLDKQYLQLDRKNLESQLKKISSVLLKISKNNYFNTFSHFGKLADMASEASINQADSVDLLEKWDYESLDFIKMEKCGNCVDFAILCKKMLLDVGVPTTIIGRFPEKKDFTKRQVDFMKYRHITPLYANESNGLNVYILEPSWKFSKPIAVSQGVSSIYKDWKSEISNINGTEFTQKAYNPQKNIHRERLFDIRPLNIDSCCQLTKRLIRIPRKLQILNKKNEEIIQFVKFDSNKQIFATNVTGVVNEFLPNFISLEQARLLEGTLEYPGLIKYLSKIYNFLQFLPNDFWIKD